MFLTDKQVRRLTGLPAAERAAQIQWLEAHRVRHWVNAAGKPIVPVSEITAPGASPPPGGWAPDFSKIGA